MVELNRRREQPKLVLGEGASKAESEALARKIGEDPKAVDNLIGEMVENAVPPSRARQIIADVGSCGIKIVRHVCNVGQAILETTRHLDSDPNVKAVLVVPESALKLVKRGEELVPNFATNAHASLLRQLVQSRTKQIKMQRAQALLDGRPDFSAIPQDAVTFLTTNCTTTLSIDNSTPKNIAAISDMVRTMYQLACIAEREDWVMDALQTFPFDKVTGWPDSGHASSGALFVVKSYLKFLRKAEKAQA